MRTTVRSSTRFLLAGGLALFLWWCLRGAALLLQARAYDEPAVWVSALLVPGTVAGLLAGGLAIARPTRWTVALFLAIGVLQVVLVLQKW